LLLNARQPLFSVFLSGTIHPSIYLRLSADIHHYKRLQHKQRTIRLPEYVIYMSQCIVWVSLFCVPIIIYPHCENMSPTSI